MQEKRDLILLIIIAILTITVSVESVLLFTDKKENNNQENSEKLSEDNNDENKEQLDNDNNNENQELEGLKKLTKKILLNGKEHEISYILSEPKYVEDEDGITPYGNHYYFDYEIYIDEFKIYGLYELLYIFVEDEDIYADDKKALYEEAKKRVLQVTTFKDSDNKEEYLLFNGYLPFGTIGQEAIAITNEYGVCVYQDSISAAEFSTVLDPLAGIFYEKWRHDADHFYMFYITENKIYYTTPFCSSDDYTYGNTLSIHRGNPSIKTEKIKGTDSC